MVIMIRRDKNWEWKEFTISVQFYASVICVVFSVPPHCLWAGPLVCQIPAEENKEFRRHCFMLLPPNSNVLQ